ncbi:MTAP family purine nucleoside phosphorylase [Candidatus Woesearchaeota archaeon]|nr:MTAP family purine nucleoside phosphorylase [Candidatus Woesearchaeota archaeon]
MVRNLVAVIGGSGVHDSPAFQDAVWKKINTRLVESEFLADSCSEDGGFVEYQQGEGVIFIPRHGYTVRYGPSKTQYKANILAAKMLGADIIIATSAVGSLHGERIRVEDLVIPDDYIDESRRDDNFFGQGIVVHANPRPAFSPELRELLIDEAKTGNYFQAIHDSGTYVVIPGDRFGTSVEGKKRAAYADIVGMTVCPEAALALQLGMHYACAAFPVDIDTDANHEGQTLAVMQRLSAPEKVPAYVTAVVRRAQTLELPDLLHQLQGNIIPGNVEHIANPHLRIVAEGLVKKYCSK